MTTHALIPGDEAAAARCADYRLIGPCSERAAAAGLVAAEWYHTDVPRKRMKELMRRSDGRRSATPRSGSR